MLILQITLATPRITSDHNLYYAEHASYWTEHTLYCIDSITYGTNHTLLYSDHCPYCINVGRTSYYTGSTLILILHSWLWYTLFLLV